MNNQLAECAIWESTVEAISDQKRKKNIEFLTATNMNTTVHIFPQETRNSFEHQVVGQLSWFQWEQHNSD